MMDPLRYTQIIAVDKHLPDDVISNDRLSSFCDTTDGWIQARTRIKERRYADVKQGTSDLACEAARKALARAAMPADQLDLIIAATQSPDFYFDSKEASFF